MWINSLKLTHVNIHIDSLYLYHLYLHILLLLLIILPVFYEGFPSGASSKEPACQGRRHKRRGFNPWAEGMTTCYGVQACSAHCKISQWTWDEVLELGRDYIQELADWEDGRLASQNNQFLRTWMLDLLWIRDGGRWGNKVKRPFNSCKFLIEWQASGRGMC